MFGYCWLEYLLSKCGTLIFKEGYQILSASIPLDTAENFKSHALNLLQSIFNCFLWSHTLGTYQDHNIVEPIKTWYTVKTCITTVSGHAWGHQHLMVTHGHLIQCNCLKQFQYKVLKAYQDFGRWQLNKGWPLNMVLLRDGPLEKW